MKYSGNTEITAVAFKNINSIFKGVYILTDSEFFIFLLTTESDFNGDTVVSCG